MTNTPTEGETQPTLTAMPVSLAWVEELDRCSSGIGESGAFGDCYLCENNPVFAGVRRAALVAGYRFSSEDDELWRDYQSFGLITLQRIIETKTIPFLDTGNTFRRLRDGNPRATLPMGFLLSSMRPNHAFHESAHCVAHEAMLGANGSFVLEAALAESYANTVEKLGSLVQTRPLTDPLFYTLNSYMPYAPKHAGAFAEAEQSLGRQRRFVLTMTAFFEANLAAAGEIPESALQRIMATVEAPGILPVVEAAFRLSAGFRDQTTPAWFGFLGYGKEYQALLHSEWLARPENQQFIRKLAAELWETSGRP